MLSLRSYYVVYIVQIFIICFLCSCTSKKILMQSDANTPQPSYEHRENKDTIKQELNISQTNTNQTNSNQANTSQGNTNDKLVTEIQTSKVETTQSTILDTSFKHSSAQNIPSTATLFQDTLKATLEESLDATLNHLSSHYIIDRIYTEESHVDNTSPVHIIKATFTTNTPNIVIDCGTIKDEALLADNKNFSYLYQGADTPVFTMEKRNNTYMNASKTLFLKGEITLSLQAISAKKTSISLLTKYVLTQDVIYTPIRTTRSVFRDKSQKETVTNVMEFYTGETGAFPIEKSMQCDAKTVIENSIINTIKDYLDKK